jgi:purine-binding chemotaxis protein CheW
MKHNDDEIESKNEDKTQFITFRVQNYEYGVEMDNVKEIKGTMHITSLPNTPQYVLGVINLRGTVVPVFDLKCRFGLGHSETTKNHVILILTIGTKLMGLLADSVNEIMTVSSSEIRNVPLIQVSDLNEEESIFKGIVNIDNRMIVLLNADQIFDNNVDIFHESMSQDFDTYNASKIKVD